MGQRSTNQVTIAHDIHRRRTLTQEPPRITLRTTNNLILARRLTVTRRAIANRLGLIPIHYSTPLVRHRNNLSRIFTLGLALKALVSRRVRHQVCLATRDVNRSAGLTTRTDLPHHPDTDIRHQRTRRQGVNAAYRTLNDKSTSTRAHGQPQATTSRMTAGVTTVRANLDRRTVGNVRRLGINIATARIITARRLHLTHLPVGPTYHTNGRINQNVRHRRRHIIIVRTRLMRPCRSGKGTPLHNRHTPRILSFTRHYHPRRT